MEIKTIKFNIELSYNELSIIADGLKTSIIKSIENYWVQHQAGWQLQEKERLEMCKIMYEALGLKHIYEEIFEKAKEIFKKHNEA